MKQIISALLDWLASLKSYFSEFELNRELDSTELLKGAFTLLGALLVLLTVTYSLRDVEVKKVQLSLAQELPKLIPNFRNNYTNELSADGKTITVYAILRNQSALPSYLYPPTVVILDKQENVIDGVIESSDIKQLNGILSPNSDYRVTYTLSLKDGFTTDGHIIRILFSMDMLNDLKTVYRDLYTDIPDTEWSSVEQAWTLEYKYEEQLYPHGTNDIWEGWWKNPR